MEGLLSWDILGTYAGVTMIVTLIVQYLKLPLDKVWKIPTRVLVYVISCIVLILTQVFLKTFSFDNLILSLLNGFVVSFASFGAYEVTFKKFDREEG